MGIIQEIRTYFDEAGTFDYGFSGADILLVLTIISTSFLVRLLWVTVQDIRMFDGRLFTAYLCLTAITMFYAWPRILTMPGAFAGIIVLIVMFWGARTWTA